MSAPVVSAKDQALAFAERGFHVLPLFSVSKRGDKIICNCRYKEKCQAPAKHPAWRYAPNGFKDASVDTAILKKWFGSFCKHNVGIATGSVSGIVVIDIDKKHGGYEALAALEAKYGMLPTTLRFLTGGGGVHILFRHPGKETRNSTGQLGSGIDVRGDGGYIVAPPSLHVSGDQYSIAEGCSLETPLAALPAWLHRLMQQSGGHNRSTGNKPTIGELVRSQIPEGQRNSTIARISGHLLAKHIDPHICFDLMLAFNEARCAPPLDAAEVVQIVTSIEKRAFTQLINRK